MRILIILLLINALCMGQSSLAESREALREQLEGLLFDIQSLRKNIEVNQAGYQRLQKSQSKLKAKLHALDQQIQQQQEKLIKLQQIEATKKAEMSEFEAELARHRGQYSAQIKAAHHLTGQHQLKLLLSSNHPGEVMRDSVIYEYIHNQRMAAIEETKMLLSRHQQRVDDLRAQQASIASLRGQLVKDRALKEKAVAEQFAMLRNVKKDLHSQELTLQAKNKQVAELNEVLAELGSSAAVNLAGLPKGQLAWPLKGELLHDFASVKNTDAATRWNGVAIAAAEGAVFAAIAEGSVVFSDWIRGLGIVTIVDHGQDYLSLYAHAQSVYVQVGDAVVKGQALGTVGDTGNAAETMLYFEIRKNGKPVNPKQWCVRPKLAVAKR